MEIIQDSELRPFLAVHQIYRGVKKKQQSLTVSSMLGQSSEDAPIKRQWWIESAEWLVSPAR
jgi:hypothetical protein